MEMRCTSPSVKALVVDLAGTILDYGSCAPSGAFVELFRRHGVQVTDGQARMPMGMNKRAHIEAMLAFPEVLEQWRTQRGTDPVPQEIDNLYDEFIPLQVGILPDFCEAFPDALDALRSLQSEGLRIGVNTGYNLEMLEIVLNSLKEQEFVPDSAACSDDVPQGRPAPWLIYRVMQVMDVYPPCCVAAVGDTIADIESARNAGVWAIGVTDTGNMVAMNHADYLALDSGEQARLRQAGRDRMEKAGAHIVLNGVGDIRQALAQINIWLMEGRKP